MARKSRSKSISQVEGVEWPVPGPRASPLLAKCYELRKRPLSQLTLSDWRTLISQDIGLSVLMPMAIEVVEKDPLIETEHYRGDLLVTILRASPLFFRETPEIKFRVDAILETLPPLIQALDFIDFDTSTEALEEARSIFRKESPAR